MALAGESSPQEKPVFGGRLVVALRAEPRTFNPVTALDAPSRDVIRRMMGDLITIDRETNGTTAGLAEAWSVSPDGKRYHLRLRPGLRFSDGHPCTAEDVVFSLETYLDPKIASPQRDLLIVGGKPVRVTQLGPLEVQIDMELPYAAGDRLFDSLAVLPSHLLSEARAHGSISSAWPLSTDPSGVAGLGPFRLKQYRAGEFVLLERNPYYWKRDKAGRQLPYLDEVKFLFAGSEEAQVTRFLAGDTDILNRAGGAFFAMLDQSRQKRGDTVSDLGPGLEYEFLVFNLQPVPRTSQRQWFASLPFRQAISAAIDRNAIAKAAYAGHAVPLASHVSPGNRRWYDPGIATPVASRETAHRKLTEAGVHLDPQGRAVAQDGVPVSFTLLVSSSSKERQRSAIVIAEDLRRVGIQVQVVSLEFRAMVDRVMNKRDFDACLLGLGGGDADPNSEMNVWLSSGAMHLWNPSQPQPATEWEAEIDRLMRDQLVERRPAERKRLYSQVQRLVARHLPIIPLVSPNVIAAARNSIGNFQPVVLDHNTLWNVDRLYLRGGKGLPR